MRGERLIIVGAGGFGREVLAWAREAAEPLPVHGFLDDRGDALAGFAVDVPVIAGVREYQPVEGDRLVCAMGRVPLKMACVDALVARGAEFWRLLHRTAVIGHGVRIGRGVILCPFAVIGSHAVLGDFVTVNYHSTVAHDAVVGRGSQIHCHADITGGVVLGENVTVGSHASVLPGVRVGDGATIGAGSLVMKDVPAGASVFASPARPLAMREAS